MQRNRQDRYQRRQQSRKNISRKHQFNDDLTNFDDESDEEQACWTPEIQSNQGKTLRARNSDVASIKGVVGRPHGRTSRGARKSIESERRYYAEHSANRNEQTKDLKQYDYSRCYKSIKGEQLRAQRSLYSNQFLKQESGLTTDALKLKSAHTDGHPLQSNQQSEIETSRDLHESYDAYGPDEQQFSVTDGMFSSFDKLIQLNPEYDAYLKKMMLQKKMKERLSQQFSNDYLSKSNLTNIERKPSCSELYKDYIKELKQYTKQVQTQRAGGEASPDVTTQINVSATQYSRNVRNSLKNDIIKRIVQSQDSHDLQQILRNGQMASPTEYDCQSESNFTNQQLRQRRLHYSDFQNQKVPNSLVNPQTMQLNQTPINRLTSPSEDDQEDDFEVQDGDSSPQVMSQLHFQSDQDASASQHPARKRYKSRSLSRARYPYEYGYNADTRDRKIFVAREGQNIFRLGAKLQSSERRKPPPIGSQEDTNEDHMSYDFDDADQPTSLKPILKSKARPKPSFVETNDAQNKKNWHRSQIPSLDLSQQDDDKYTYDDLQRKISSDSFDPVSYLSVNTLVCKKYNYAVPENYGYSDVIIRFNKEKDTIDIFNVEHLMNRSTRDDGDVIHRGGQKLFKLDKLIHSIKVKEINGFIYGPFSTRFWMMRMGINQLIVDNNKKAKTKVAEPQNKKKGGKGEKLDKIFDINIDEDVNKEGETSQNDFNWESCLPFEAWNCISIQLEDRDISLVLSDERSMKILILFLIMKLKTYNGIRNSLNQLKKHNIIKRSVPIQAMLQRIYFNFFMMKFRMKISFEACKRQRTIKEHLLIAILRTYLQRDRDGLLENPYPKVTPEMVQGIREICIKNFTSKTMQDEAKQIEKDKMIQKSQSEIQIQRRNSQIGNGIQTFEVNENKEQKGLENQTQMFQVLSKSILTKDGIDDLFEKHYESDSGIERKKLVETYVKQVKDDHHHGHGDEHEGAIGSVHAHTMTRELKETAEDVEARKFLTYRNKFIFKKKIAKTEKKTLYNRIMLLVKLRVLAGPLLIYSLLECIKLSKQILTLDLEMGREVVIPQELNIKDLPFCFQFYDCILEMVSDSISQEQKVILARREKHKKIQQTGLKDLKKSFNQQEGEKINEKVEISLGERLGRYVKDMFSKDEQQERQEIRDEEYESYLQLYTKAENIQAARYIEMNKNQFRRLTQQNSTRNNSRRGRISRSYTSRPGAGMRFLSKSYYEDIEDFGDEQDEAIKNEDLMLDLNYITHKQVGRKRSKVFATKILFQNQLTALKEKGKRLLMCQMIDRESRAQAEKFLGAVEPGQEAPRQDFEVKIADIDKKLFMDGKQNIEDAFGKSAILHQEANVQQLRLQLVKNLVSKKTFNARNQLIDNKIQYDQRFFQDGYAEFQLLISDIRKQIRLNEEVLRLKRQLQNIYDDINKEDVAALIQMKGSTDADQPDRTLKKRRSQLRNNIMKHSELQQQLQEKQEELAEQKRIDEENAKEMQKEWQKKQALKRDTHNLVVQSLQSNQGQGQSSGPVTSNNTFEMQNNRISQKNMSGFKASNVEVSPLTSPTDSRYHTTNNEDEQEPLRIKKKLATPENNALMLALKRAATSAMDEPGGKMHLFQQLSAVTSRLSEDHPRKLEIQQIQSKIAKKRSRIKHVSQHSQQSLWGKDGGYQPAQVKEEQ